jgi:hypothetical protein
LFVSDFDQTLSFNDSGIVLSELIGAAGFAERILGLSQIHLVQQGGELAYLLLHDPEYRRVRKEHLIEAGKRIRLKQNIRLLIATVRGSRRPPVFVLRGFGGPAGSDPVGARRHRARRSHLRHAFRYDPETGEIQSIARVPAGYGKVAVLDELRAALPLSRDRIVYVGDGSSDVHVMMHVNRLDGLTIAVSENKYINQIAQRTVLSDDALSVLVPVLETIVGWTPLRIREFFEGHGFVLREWDKVQTDSLTICRVPVSKQASDGFDADRPLLCNLGENAVQRAGLQRVCALEP